MKKILLLLLMLLLLITAASCDKNANEPVQTTPSETTTSEPPAVNPGMTYTIKVVNGKLPNGKTQSAYAENKTVVLTADVAPNGYRFLYWENSAGEQVSTEKNLQITVTESETYKAYYEVFFGTSAPSTTVLTDLSKDWAQGGINGKLNAFSTTDKTRISFAEPYFLEKGDTLNVTIPRDTYFTCPYATDDDDTTVPCEDGCEIMVCRILLKKNNTEETGDLFTDYTLVKAVWIPGGFSYEATEDIYVMATVKYNLHGGSEFSTSQQIMQEMKVEHILYQPAVTTEETPIGAYWTAELEDAIEKIENNRETIGEGVSEFFYITDTHWEKYNAHYSPALINYLAERLGEEHVVFGGDVVENSTTKQEAINNEVLPFFNALSAYTKTGETFKIMATLGNHDRNYNLNKTQQSASQILTNRDAYNYYTKQMEGWGVTTSGNPYRSYYDDAENHVRYIQFYFSGVVLNGDNPIIEEALDWTEARIKELDNSWTVVLFSHAYFNDAVSKPDEIADRLLEIKAEAEAEIAIWITGHTHSDMSEILVSYDGQTALRVISLNCDSYSKKGSGTVAMTLSTVTEQSFSFFQIDKENHKIYLTRFGAAEDLVLNYGEAMEGEWDKTPRYRVSVINGTANNKNRTVVKQGTEVVLVAMDAPAGYTFSCWKNAKGEVLGTTSTLKVEVTSDTVYKPYYVDTDPTNDTLVEGQILADFANDW